MQHTCIWNRYHLANLPTGRRTDVTHQFNRPFRLFFHSPCNCRCEQVTFGLELRNFNKLIYTTHSQVQGNNLRQQHSEERMEWILSYKLFQVQIYHRCPVNQRLQKSLGRRKRDEEYLTKDDNSNSSMHTTSHPLMQSLRSSVTTKAGCRDYIADLEEMFFLELRIWKDIYTPLPGKR